MMFQEHSKKIERTSFGDEELDQWRSRSGRHWEYNSGKSKKSRRKARKNRNK